MSAGIDAQSAARIAQGIRDAADGVADLQGGLEEAGHLLEAAAQAAAPRRTGRLAQSHSTTVHAGVLTLTAAVRYAAPVHAHNPWMERALIAQTGHIIDALAQDVDAHLAHITGD